MTARPVINSTGVVNITDPITVRMDNEDGEPFVVTQNDSEDWRVLSQARDANGQVQDMQLTARQELVTAPGNNVIYDTVYSGTPVANTVILGPYPAEGFVSAVVQVSSQFGSGLMVQVSFDGITWVSLLAYQQNMGVSISNTPSTTLYTVNTPYIAALPAARYIRVAVNATTAITSKVYLGLSKTPRADYVTSIIAGSQSLDNNVISSSSAPYPIITGAIDATKKPRPLAGDGTYNPRSQGATNSATGAALNLPYYGNVLAPAIARANTQNYLDGQPAALQANSRGELQVDFQSVRNMLEQEQLLVLSQGMQQMDPNWGFEIR